MTEHEKLKNGNRLSTTTIDLLHLMNEFGKLHKVKDEFTIHLVDDQLQKNRNRYVWNTSDSLLC